MPGIDNALGQPLIIVNTGLSGFAKRLGDQQVQVVPVNSVPRADGDQEMIDLPDQLL